MINHTASELEQLAIAADDIGNSDSGLSFFDYDELANPIHHEIVGVLGKFLIIDAEWNGPRAAALLDCDPKLFSSNDAKLAVRALWKSDRVGFYWGGYELYRSSWISKFLRSACSFKNDDAFVPAYPSPDLIDGHFDPKTYWHGIEGYLQQGGHMKTVYVLDAPALLV